MVARIIIYLAFIELSMEFWNVIAMKYCMRTPK